MKKKGKKEEQETKKKKKKKKKREVAEGTYFSHPANFCKFNARALE